MKKFLQRASRSFSVPSKDNQSVPTSTSNPTASHTVGLQPKFLVPPVPHPCPWDHIAILVTNDALFLKPHFPERSNSTPLSYVRIPFGKGAEIQEVPASSGDELDWDESVIVYGILGVLELITNSYLLVITSRSEVGQHLDPSHVVYCLKGVTPIPLIPDKARMAINTLASRNIGLTRPSLLPKSPTSDLMTPSTSGLDAGEILGQTEPALPSPPKVQFSTQDDVRIMTPRNAQTFDLNTDEHAIYDHNPSSSASSSVSDLSTPSSEGGEPISPVVKTLAERLSFWSRLSKRTSTASPSTTDFPLSQVNSKQLDDLLQEEEPNAAINNILESTAPAPQSSEEQHSELEEKIVKEVIREFSKGGMYFAYTFDLTRSLQHKKDLVAKSEKQHEILSDLNALPSPDSSQTSQQHAPEKSLLSEPDPTLPLWRRVDRHFWWNEWLSKPFIDAGLHSYVLPIMQGYVQIARFVVPPDPVTSDEDTPVDYIVVSRRSRNRAGLRYQRRGIDDEAHVANFVETETIVHVNREKVDNVFGFVQIRGSIPLFWTQTGYGLKPPPILSEDRTAEQSLEAMKKHFARSVTRYGPHQCVNLAEQHGKEAAVTDAYRNGAAKLGNSDVNYYEYDFHTETKGMKYENISMLITTMEQTFNKQGYLWIANNVTMTEQKGVFRTNCIDCLDRTNVVQSAFARYVLNKQLGAVGLINPSNSENRGIIDVVFNDVWANNGDAISRAYAGTSALKGDFTRTGKRDLTGMLNDGVNSLARMYTSTFSDWFSQAVIDFMLGSRTVTVFSEFLLRLQSSDPRDLIRLSKIRAEAIATSVSRVLLEGERLLSGWTLFAPADLNTRMADKFEEKVFLLSAKAVYIVRYDYTLQKVKSYTRVPLGDITGISKGAYIVSPLEEASRDPVQNAGFVITWLNSNQTTRVTSYSIRNSVDSIASDTSSTQVKPAAPAQPPPPSRAPTITSIARRRLSTLGRKGSTLSDVLAPPTTNTSFAAFKVPPLDPPRLRRAASGGSDYADGADSLTTASTCKEAMELIVDAIQRACEDVGNSTSNFIADEDVVSLSEAERQTTVYAKMEYGVKRLLWLGAS